MKTITLRKSMFGMCIALVTLGVTAPAYAYSAYRSVTTNAGTGVVAWVQANFGVSGNPPTLSFFYFATDADARLGLPNAQCFVKVDLPGVAAVPAQGAQSTVGNANIPVNGAPAEQPLPFPWTIEFDNNPAGHWSIARTEISTAGTNAAASRVAAAGFRSLATTVGSGVTVVNGTLANCTAQ